MVCWAPLWLSLMYQVLSLWTSPSSHLTHGSPDWIYWDNYCKVCLSHYSKLVCSLSLLILTLARCLKSWFLVLKHRRQHPSYQKLFFFRFKTLSMLWTSFDFPQSLSSTGESAFWDSCFSLLFKQVATDFYRFGLPSSNKPQSSMIFWGSGCNIK